MANGDVEPNGVIIYTILSGNEDGFFSMDATNGSLYLVRQLDRESMANDRFSLVIQASWIAVSGFSSAVRFSLTRLIIDIIDVNDNAPKFSPVQRSISIVENLPNDFSVLKLTATDPDKVLALFFSKLSFIFASLYSFSVVVRL